MEKLWRMSASFPIIAVVILIFGSKVTRIASLTCNSGSCANSTAANLSRPSLDLNTTNLESSNSSVTFEESSGFVNILKGTTQRITNLPGTNISHANFSILSRHDGLREFLQLDPQVGSSHPYIVNEPDVGAGTLILAGVADLDTWLLLLRSVQYINSNVNISDVPRRVSVVIRDEEERSSQPVFVDIFISLFNNPPELYLGGLGIRNFSANFVLNGPCVSLTAPNVELVERDSSGIASIRVTVNGENLNTDFERIDYNGTRPEGLTSIGGNTTLIISLSRASLLSEYEAVLRNLVYCNGRKNSDSVGSRTVLFAVHDTGLVAHSGNLLNPAESSSSTLISLLSQPHISFSPLDELAVRGVPTPIINSSSINIRSSGVSTFDLVIVSITNPQDGILNELIVFSGRLPGETTLDGPFRSGQEFLYTVRLQPFVDGDSIAQVISMIRYNNRAAHVTLLPPRQVCVKARATNTLFSPPACINISLALPNSYSPVFLTRTTTFNINRTSDPTTIATIEATDSDTGLEGQVVYSISDVLSRGQSLTESTQNVFSIEPMSGMLSAPGGLSGQADRYFTHLVTILASDQGNPVRSTPIQITVNILDFDPPLFLHAPYMGSLFEEIPHPATILRVFAMGRDYLQPQNNFISYHLLNHQDKFTIDEHNGVVMSSQPLDADETQTYILSVSATDLRGLASYANVTVNLIDINDNAAMVDQRTPAVHVVNSNTSSSIGPAILINDIDITSSAITSINITLIQASYYHCLTSCQDERLREANLLPPATNLLSLAVLVNASLSTIGEGNCSAITVSSDPEDSSLNGYGEIQRHRLPAGFASGEFSVSFVLNQTSEGFILQIPSTSGSNITFGIEIQQQKFLLHYIPSSQPETQLETVSLSPTDTLQEFFNPTSPAVRHYTVVIRDNPQVAMLYVNCMFVASASLRGVIAVNSDSIVYIGSRPSPLANNTLSAQIHGLYYHPMALNESQINEFCRCGSEALVLPPISERRGMRMQIAPNQYSVLIEGNVDWIPSDIAIFLLRSINYTTDYPEANPLLIQQARELYFRVTELSGMAGLSTGSIVWVSSDESLPTVDLDGLNTRSIDSFVQYEVHRSPVIVSPNVVVSRRVREVPSLIPTLNNVRVELVNAADSGEQLSVRHSSGVLTIIVSNSNKTLDIIGPGLPSDFNTVLQAIEYVNLNSNPSIAVEQRMVSFIVHDTEGRTNPVPAIGHIRYFTVSVSSPQLFLDRDTAVHYLVGSSGVRLAPNVTISHGNNLALVRAEVAIVSSRQTSFDTLENNNHLPGVASTFNGTVLVFTGVASLLEYQTILSEVTFLSSYTPSPSSPAASLTRSITIRVYDGRRSSNIVTVQLQIVPQNRPPVITLTNSEVTLKLGDILVPIAPSANVTDADDKVLRRMVVELEISLDNDTLSTGNQIGPQHIFGQGTPDHFSTILRSISYINRAKKPFLASQNINIQVCDFSDCTNKSIVVTFKDSNSPAPIIAAVTLSVVTVLLLLAIVLILEIFLARRHYNIMEARRYTVMNPNLNTKIPYYYVTRLQRTDGHIVEGEYIRAGNVDRVQSVISELSVSLHHEEHPNKTETATHGYVNVPKQSSTKSTVQDHSAQVVRAQPSEEALEETEARIVARGTATNVSDQSSTSAATGCQSQPGEDTETSLVETQAITVVSCDKNIPAQSSTILASSTTKNGVQYHEVQSQNTDTEASDRPCSSVNPAYSAPEQPETVSDYATETRSDNEITQYSQAELSASDNAETERQ